MPRGSPHLRDVVTASAASLEAGDVYRALFIHSPSLTSTGKTLPRLDREPRTVYRATPVTHALDTFVLML